MDRIFERCRSTAKRFPDVGTRQEFGILDRLFSIDRPRLLIGTAFFANPIRPPKTNRARGTRARDSRKPGLPSAVENVDGRFRFFSRRQRPTRKRPSLLECAFALRRTFRPRGHPRGQKRSASGGRASPCSLVLERGKRRPNERQASASTGMMLRGLHQANALDLSTAGVGGLRAQPATA